MLVWLREVEDPVGHRPAESSITSKFGRRIVSDEQDVRARRVRWRRPKLVKPDMEAASAAQFASDQANWDRALAGDGGELEVHHHHLAEHVEH